MNKYEVLSMAGEGSYGVVMKCRHKQSRRMVAIKKLIDSENDLYVKKMAFREIRILKKLDHENVVKMLEVFKKKGRYYLVFEYVEQTVLDELEKHPNGVGERRTEEYMLQLIRAVHYCHSKNVIHRDIKPENMLLSKYGVVKLCDFGFARTLCSSSTVAAYTEYIATRWYRAPELIVRDTNYGRPVDIWSVGCVFAELMSGEPLFAGDSDIDQLYQITRRFGKLTCRHSNMLKGLNLFDQHYKIDDDSSPMNTQHALHNIFPKWSFTTLSIVSLCLQMDPDKRCSAAELLMHDYFAQKNFAETFSNNTSHKRFSANNNGNSDDINSTTHVNSNLEAEKAKDRDKWRTILAAVRS